MRLKKKRYTCWKSKTYTY